jgi:hypothetical protein
VDQLAGVGPAVDADHDPLPEHRRRLVLGQLRPEELALLLLGDLAQGEGAQRDQVVHAEEVGEGGADLLGGVDPSLGDPLPQRVGRQVDQDDLVGLVQQPVGEGLTDPHAGDLVDLVVEALQVLDVHGGEDVDAGLQQLLDVLPALGVAAARVVGVGQLVHQAELGRALQQPVGVHLGERPALDPGDAAGRDLQAGGAVLGGPPPVRLQVADHHVHAGRLEVTCLAEHGVGLADAGGRAEEHLEPSPRAVPRAHRRPPRSPAGRGVEGEVQLQHVHPRLPEKA